MVRVLSLVREETGGDIYFIYNKMPLICVNAFEHMWFSKQGNTCKWFGTETADELAVELLSS